jgi:hypothetical protein
MKAIVRSTEYRHATVGGPVEVTLTIIANPLDASSVRAGDTIVIGDHECKHESCFLCALEQIPGVGEF